MNEADLARLQLARRAFKAAAPSELEVQVAVRRARLALLRPRKSRSLVGKGMVVLVLAIGGLAYARPQAMGELLGSALPVSPGASSLGRSLAQATPRPAAAAQRLPNQALRSPAVEPTPASEARSAPAQDAAPARTAAAQSAAPVPGVALRPAAAARAAKPAVTASEWGNVAHALASGDEASALASLDNLSRSEDPHTRDKADLGRAQLLLSRGERASACALARSLLERPLDRHLERQARAFLNDCAR